MEREQPRHTDIPSSDPPTGAPHPVPTAPEDTPAPAPAPPPPRLAERARGSLRRRVLLILLFSTTLPGYFALLLLWITVARDIKQTTSKETIDRAASIALTLDRALSEAVAPLQRAVSEPAAAASLRALIDRKKLGLEDDLIALPPSSFEAPAQFADSPVYIVGEGGRLIGEVKGRHLLFKVARPTTLDGTDALSQLEKNLPGTSFVIEPTTQDWSNPILIVGIPLAAAQGDASAEPMAIVSVLPLLPIFREVERQNPIFGQRLVVVSRRSGTIYTTQADDDFQLALNRYRVRMFDDGTEPEAGELMTVKLRSQNLGIAGIPVRSLQSLSITSQLKPVDWMVVQAVDLDESLASIRPMFWFAVIVGLALTVFALILAIIVSARLVRPILRLTDGMQHFSRGELDYRVNVATGDEVEILANAANDMAASLRAVYDDLAARMKELDDKARQLELIHSISYSVNRVLDLDQLFERIIREMLNQIPCERISLAILNEARTELRLDYVYPDNREHMPRGMSIPVHDSVMGRALKDQALTLRRIRKDGKFFEDGILYPLGLHMLCVVPLVANNGAVGTLNLACVDPEMFNNQRIKLLERIADTLALAVEHGRLFARVARFAEELEETVEKRTQELRAAQARLVQTEKFAATGSIAAHIGHEVNNPLSIIKNYLRIMTGRMDRATQAGEDAKPFRDGLSVIEEEIDRIARIIGQLRQVSKPSKAEASDISIPSELRKMTDLFHGTLGKRGIELELDIDDSIGSVHLVGDYLRQIIINFVRNSMDAIEESGGGIITIRARRGIPTEKHFFVEVEDTGSGIPNEVLGKIFDPFFTTKAEGKGTGLGLSVSFNLAQAMGGTVEARSTVGQGTTMRLILPLAAPQTLESDATPEEGDSASSAPPVRRRGQKIIIG